MLKTSPSRQLCWNWSRLTKVVTPLSLGVALLTSAQMPVAAKPVVVVQPPLPSTSIIGSPIPSPVPVNPYTGKMCAFSPNECRGYDTVIIPGRQVIRRQTLINPRVINSRVSDSVLVNPVIINSPGYSQGTFRGSSVIYSSPVYSSPVYSSPIYSSPTYSSPGGLRIRVGR
ncbi:MAG TPA: hypothetical protein V6D48_26350 [Oculatellaceae cyanobacterium]